MPLSGERIDCTAFFNACPHSGARPFRQKSTCLTQSTYVVQNWSRKARKFEPTNPPSRLPAPSTSHIWKFPQMSHLRNSPQVNSHVGIPPDSIDRQLVIVFEDHRSDPGVAGCEKFFFFFFSRYVVHVKLSIGEVHDNHIYSGRTHNKSVWIDINVSVWGTGVWGSQWQTSRHTTGFGVWSLEFGV